MGDARPSTATRIPDPAGLIREVHSLGVRFMLWVSPKVICSSATRTRRSLGTPENRTLDLRQASVRRRVPGAPAQGCSRSGSTGSRATAATRSTWSRTARTLQNDYPLLFAQSVLRCLPHDAGAIFRAASTGSQRVPGLWAGDQSGDWSGLQRAIRAGQTASVSGFPMWGSDVGGYSVASTSPGTSSRAGPSSARSRRCWRSAGSARTRRRGRSAPTAMRVLRASAVLHYELFPYLYGLLRRGEPVLRPLGYGYPGRPGGLEGRPRAARRARPARRAGDRAGNDPERVPAEGRAGSTCTRARR